MDQASSDGSADIFQKTHVNSSDVPGVTYIGIGIVNVKTLMIYGSTILHYFYYVRTLLRILHFLLVRVFRYLFT